MEARRVSPPIGLYPYPEHAPPFVPPWLRKPPVIVLPVEPHGVTVYPLLGASS